MKEKPPLEVNLSQHEGIVTVKTRFYDRGLAVVREDNIHLWFVVHVKTGLMACGRFSKRKSALEAMRQLANAFSWEFEKETEIPKSEHQPRRQLMNKLKNELE